VFTARLGSSMHRTRRHGCALVASWDAGDSATEHQTRKPATGVAHAPGWAHGRAPFIFPLSRRRAEALTGRRDGAGGIGQSTRVTLYLCHPRLGWSEERDVIRCRCIGSPRRGQGADRVDTHMVGMGMNWWCYGRAYTAKRLMWRAGRHVQADAAQGPKRYL
jgi:hypothetical protein